MFTLSMSSSELAAEYRLDLPEIKESNSKFDKSQMVSKTLRKKYKSESVGFERVIKTARNNKYLNVFTYVRSGKPKKGNTCWGYHIYTLGLIQTFKGECAITFFRDSTLGVIVQPHFFKRYKERMMEQCDWSLRNKLHMAKSIEDIIAIYIRRNGDTLWVPTKSVYGKRQHLFAVVNDGVGLYQWNVKNKQLQCNTFITKEMFSKEQQEMSDIALEYKDWYLDMSDTIDKLINLTDDSRKNV